MKALAVEPDDSTPPRIESPELARTPIEELADDLERAPGPQSKARLEHRIGLHHELVAKDLQQARIHYERSLALQGSFGPAIRGLRRLCVASSEWQAALDHCDLEVKGATDSRLRAAALRMKGFILEACMGAREGALDAYRAALEIERGDLISLAAMGRNEEVLERWEAAARTLEREANAVGSDPSLRAALIERRAQILESQVDQAQLAIAQYETALELSPTAPGCMRALTRLYTVHGRFRDLVRVLESQAASALDPEVQAALLYAAAKIQLDRLGNRPSAAALLERARQSAPNHQLLLLELCEMREADGDHKNLVPTLEALVLSGGAGADQLSDMHRVATLLQDQPDKLDEAQKWLERALGVDPGYGPAIEGLTHLCMQQRRWENLLALYEAEATGIQTEAQRGAVWFRMGTLCERRLNRRDEAIEYYERALRAAPTCLPALDALIRLRTQERKMDVLPGLLTHDGSRSEKETRCADWLLGAGLLEATESDGSQAAALYRRVLEYEPDNSWALRGLSRLSERAGRYAELVPFLDKLAEQASDRSQKWALLVRCAAVLEDELGDCEGAATRLKAAMVSDPRHPAARRVLGRLFTRLGQWEALVVLYQSEAEQAGNTDRAGQLLLKMAEIYEHRLSKHGEAIDLYRQALVHDPNCSLAARGLARKLREQGKWDDLRFALAREAHSETRPEARALAHFRLGEVLEHRLDRHDAAVEAYSNALEELPGYAPASEAVRRLRAVRGDYRALAESFESGAYGAGDPRDQAAAHVHAAELLRDKVRDIPRAIQAFERALALAPERVGTLLSLSALYRKSGRRVALSDTLTMLAKTVTHPEARAAVLRELAGLKASAPEAPAPLTALRAWTASTPSDLEATLWIDLYAPRLGDEAALESAWLRLSEVSQDRETGGSYLCALASQREAVDPEQAKSLYMRANELGRDCAEAERALARLNGASAVFVRATPEFTAPLVANDVPAPVTHGAAPANQAVAQQFESALTELRSLGAKAPTLSVIRDLEQVLEADPDHAAAAKELRGVMLRISAPQRLVDILSMAAQRAQPPSAARLWCDAASICVEQLDNSAQAIGLLSKALTRLPDSVPVTRALSALFCESGQWNEARGLLERALHVAPDADAKKQLYLDLASLFDVGLDDQSASVEHVRRALALAPTDQEAFDRLSDLLSRIAVAQRPAAPKPRSEEPNQPPRARHSVDRMVAPSFARPVQRAAAEDTQKKAAEAATPGLTRREVGTDTLRLRFERAVRLRDEGSAQQAVQELRLLLGLDPERYDVWAELCECFERIGYGEAAFRCAQAMEVLDPQGPRRLSKSLLRMPQPGQVAAWTFSKSVLDEIGADLTPWAPVGELIAALGDGLGELFQPQLSSYGLSTRARISAGDPHPLRVRAERIAEIVGAAPFDVYLHRARNKGSSIELTLPTALIFPLKLAEESEAEQVFEVAQKLILMSRNAQCVASMSSRDLEAALFMFVRQLVPSAVPPKKLDMSFTEAVTRIVAALSRSARKEAEEAAKRFMASPVDVPRWVESQQRIALRAAALIADDLGAVIHATENDDAREVLRFWASEAALKARMRTGIA